MHPEEYRFLRERNGHACGTTYTLRDICFTHRIFKYCTTTKSRSIHHRSTRDVVGLHRMRCPYCSTTETKVSDKRDTDGAIRRRRECLNCTKRFTTYERVEQITITILKKDGRKESFDTQKLRVGIVKACEKRPLTAEAVEHVVGEVELALRRLADTVVPSRTIGELVMEKLRELDTVAYLRFASVYREYDVHSLQQEIEAIAKR